VPPLLLLLRWPVDDIDLHYRHHVGDDVLSFSITMPSRPEASSVRCVLLTTIAA